MKPGPIKERKIGDQRSYLSRKKVIAALRDRMLQGKTIQARRVRQENVSLAEAVTRYFGSFAAAHAHFRLHPPRETPWYRAEKAAIIAEIRRRHAAGKSLSLKKIVREHRGTAFLNRTRTLFGRWTKAVIAAGFEPYEGAHSPWPGADRAAIITEIRRRKRAGKSLIAKKIGREKWGKPLVERAGELFGSWSAAMRAAGLLPNKQARTAWAEADRAAIIAWIQRRERNGEPLRLIQVRRAQHTRALLNRCDKLFGSWNAALLAAGSKPSRENSPWRHADKAAVIAEICQRKRMGKSLIAKEVDRDKWGNPLVKRARVLFGCWRNALLAAGITDWLIAASDYRSGRRASYSRAPRASLPASS